MTSAMTLRFGSLSANALLAALVTVACATSDGTTMY
jgi:hypothetical protein